MRRAARVFSASIIGLILPFAVVFVARLGNLLPALPSTGGEDDFHFRFAAFILIVTIGSSIVAGLYVFIIDSGANSLIYLLLSISLSSLIYLCIIRVGLLFIDVPPHTANGWSVTLMLGWLATIVGTAEVVRRLSRETTGHI
jgi:hypothetical protein